jgi:hypothetical protein
MIAAGNVEADLVHGPVAVEVLHQLPDLQERRRVQCAHAGFRGRS